MEDLSPIAAVERLHREVDRAVARLAALHAGRLACRQGCVGCCIDELTVFSVEAALIQRQHGELLRHAAPHPPGACGFLDEAGACRIYRVRPYVCRTQGLPLAWLDEGPDGLPAEYRDICELNEAALDPAALDRADCWLIGPTEARLRELQLAFGGPQLERVALRALFGPPRR